MKHYKDTDYLHAAARTAYLEKQLLTKNDLLKVVEAESADKIRTDEKQREHYELIEEITGNLGLTQVFRYPIDGHNLKVLIKAKAADGDFSHLYKTGGTVDADVLKQEMDQARFEKVPELLGTAGLEAAEQLAKTGDVQAVDLIVDRAILDLMRKKAEEIDFRPFTDYVQNRIDRINVKSALRLLRAKEGIPTAARVFSEGGSISAEEIQQAYAEGYNAVEKLAAELPREEQILERVSLPLGIEPVLRFLHLKEQEFRALGLVLSLKQSGVPKEQIEERLGHIYGD